MYSSHATSPMSDILSVISTISVIFLVLGLLFCFAGLPMRRFTQFVIGLLCGLLLSFVITLLVATTLDSILPIFVILTLLFAILSACSHKFFAFIHTFVFMVYAILILAMVAFSDMRMVVHYGASALQNIETIAIVALLVALVVAILAATKEDGAFVALVPFTGAFYAATGLSALVGEGSTGFFVVVTLVLGILGVVVQSSYLRNKRAREQANQNPTFVVFQNGAYNPGAPGFPGTPTSSNPGMPGFNGNPAPNAPRTPAPEVPKTPEPKAPSNKAEVISGVKVCPRCKTTQSPDSTSCWLCDLVFDD